MLEDELKDWFAFDIIIIRNWAQTSVLSMEQHALPQLQKVWGYMSTRPQFVEVINNKIVKFQYIMKQKREHG